MTFSTDNAYQAPIYPEVFLILVLLGVCVVFPLAVYFFVLAQLNRRRHPVVVSGVWDFAGVLFALSGLLLLGGPFIMATLNQDWRDFWLRSPFRSSEGLSEQWWYLRLGIWALYFAAIFVGSIFLLRWRSHVTSIYNVDQDTLDQALTQALDRLRLDWRRAGQLLYIGGPTLSDGQAAPETAIVTPSQVEVEDQRSRIEDRGSTEESLHMHKSGGDFQGRTSLFESRSAPEQKTRLEVNPFPAMCHATLQWSGGDRLKRREIEAELARLLGDVESPPNPSARWLMTVAGILMGVVSFGLLLLVLFVVFAAMQSF
jgi:hypothetical protein